MPAFEIVAGNSSRIVSGIVSVFLLPMYAHLPGGGVGDVATGVGVLLALGCLAGELLPGDVRTRTMATAAMITPAVPIASQADWRFLRARAADRPGARRPALGYRPVLAR